MVSRLKNMLFVVVLFSFCAKAFPWDGQLRLLPADTWVSNYTHQLVWETTPGMSYELQQSASLADDWLTVDGYPVVATNDTETYLFDISASLPDERFYRVLQSEQEVPSSSMTLIPGGTNSGTDPDYGAYSLTVDSFYMDETEVTKEQWDTVYAWAITNDYSFSNAGSGKASNHPVHTVNWYDCVKWCNARSEMDGKTPCYTVSDNTYKMGEREPECDFDANGYRLPTGDEWEYAARGGLSGKRFPWGDTIDHSLANYKANGSLYDYDTSPYTTYKYHPSYEEGESPYTSPVGSFSSNGYGLSDMSGNVWEWCWDSTGTYQSLRGGGWDDSAENARCGDGGWNYPEREHDSCGFRAVCR